MASDDVRVNFAELFNLTIATASRNLRAIALYALGMGALSSAVAAYAPSAAILDNIVQFVAGYYLLVAIIRREGFFRSGERIGNFGSYFGIAFLTGIAYVFGFLLLIFPGVFLMTRWWIAPALAVSDNLTTSEAMQQSWARTRGSQWSLMGFIAVLGLAFFIIVGMLGGAAFFMAEGNSRYALGFVEALGVNIFIMAGSGCLIASGVALLKRLLHPAADFDEIFG